MWLLNYNMQDRELVTTKQEGSERNVDMDGSITR